ncbi:uncharacterized protein M437DRAFT_76050 [Aureobasidium melanogenum CBS 110374]|uniref:Uncharacterized protein n=1 Tax=Aureobasidium melanogenum (strain CBS 110374) TaxID=1043003 RepID=A0A074VMC7_AURM1|nr:uncharacterized protein M437DRAFT_76050 [Aureobasidium melanogenum CBS 110374]KEQ61880.1 hypothetical protein M437DRAFT_76050 [Aureobasidium melanogenum CBS 110374]
MNLLELPREIRDNIYTHLFEPEANRRTTCDGLTTYTYSHNNLFCVNRQIYHEARRIFLEQNTFIKISTPFPESRYQVADHGVPIVASEACADDFSQHGLSVAIAFPLTAAEEQDTFIIHIDDLPKFCETWFYSAADYPDLNGHLALTLELRNPSSSTPLDGDSIPAEKKVLKALQERLLYPFGRIKNLLRVNVTGVPKPDEAVVAEFKRLMAIPLGSPLERLILATEHKDAGNVALMANQPLEALEHYRKAWEAMFIVVNGRSREIHGERYFETFLTSPPFEGQHGSMVSVVLRVRLVANTLLAYHKLRDLETVVHIGMRTINIMRGGRENLEPDEEAANGWIAGPEMGKIYYRTALAFKEMDDKYEARQLLKVAVLYLPNEQRVRELVRECALRLG